MKNKKAAKPAVEKKTRPKPVMVLRTCKADMTSHGGFKWPESGPVSCADWNKRPTCGNGLHGLLWGEGSGELLCWHEDAKWLVVAVPAESIVHLKDDGKIKVKFPSGDVVYCGDRLGATKYIAENGAAGKAIVGGTATAGDSGTATAGDSGTATAGDSGTATAGYRGTATAGYRGTATAGEEAMIAIKFYCKTAKRWRLAVGYIGENGIKAKTPYTVDDNGNLVEKK